MGLLLTANCTVVLEHWGSYPPFGSATHLNSYWACRTSATRLQWASNSGIHLNVTDLGGFHEDDNVGSVNYGSSGSLQYTSALMPRVTDKDNITWMFSVLMVSHLKTVKLSINCTGFSDRKVSNSSILTAPNICNKSEIQIERVFDKNILNFTDTKYRTLLYICNVTNETLSVEIDGKPMNTFTSQNSVGENWSGGFGRLLNINVLIGRENTSLSNETTRRSLSAAIFLWFYDPTQNFEITCRGDKQSLSVSVNNDTCNIDNESTTLMPISTNEETTGTSGIGIKHIGMDGY